VSSVCVDGISLVWVWVWVTGGKWNVLEVGNGVRGFSCAETKKNNNNNKKTYTLRVWDGFSVINI
jgi:hypothetical protein